VEKTVRRVQVLTEFGAFRALLSETGVRRLSFPAGGGAPSGVLDAGDRLAVQLTEQLQGYFRAELATFTVSLDLDQGDEFLRAVWAHLLTIPYGAVTTYGAVARAIGLSTAAARDVGAAVGCNPVPVIVPCHRVIGSSGKLVGFGAGLEWKLRLLAIENPARWAGGEALPGIGEEP
jgi:methylated-DNA-[protein]-cysteine S-methyltransferase